LEWTVLSYCPVVLFVFLLVALLLLRALSFHDSGAILSLSLSLYFSLSLSAH